MIHRLVLLYFLLFVLAGCLAKDNYGMSIRKWVGTREPYLVRGWGEPDQSYAKGESKFYVYDEDGGAPKGCTTTFEIVGEFVESFDYVGEGCFGDFYTHKY
ncbi:MAG: hypothetical protein WBW79_11600 [Desulfocapsaceae bacterium]